MSTLDASMRLLSIPELAELEAEAPGSAVLDLDGNALTDEAADAVVRLAVACGPALRVLRLCDNEFGDGVAAALATALPTTLNHVISVDLTGNRALSDLGKALLQRFA